MEKVKKYLLDTANLRDIIYPIGVYGIIVSKENKNDRKGHTSGC
jgi:hypothetical protein